MDSQIAQNLGVILDDPKDTDLYFGANDRVKHNVELLDRCWLTYYSSGELQIGTYFDTMGCVSFSADKIVEAILNYQIANSMISPDNVKWLRDNGYIDENGKVNLADRFTVAMSGTNSKGNSGGNVWWSIRNNGVVPEAMVPWDRSREAPMKERSADWYRDKANIPQSAIDLGLEFVKRFEVFYERIGTTRAEIESGLMYSPIHVYIPTACPKKNTIQQACSASISHAVSVCDDLDPRGYWPLFDHYVNQDKESGQERWIRRVATDYQFYVNGYVCTIVQKSATIDEESTDMPNTFVRIVRDTAGDGKTIGYFVPILSEKDIDATGKIFNKPAPRKEDGSVDWDKFIEQEASFKDV